MRLPRRASFKRSALAAGCVVAATSVLLAGCGSKATETDAANTESCMDTSGPTIKGEETGNLLRRIGGERTVVVVEHDMDFMRAFATSVTVLARGQVIAEGSVAEVQANPKVQEVYLGTAAAGAEGIS